MTAPDDDVPFGPSNAGPLDVKADDLGGSRWGNDGNNERNELSRERLTQMRWARRIALATAVLLGGLCIVCLSFSFCIGLRYLNHVERLDVRQHEIAASATEDKAPVEKLAPEKEKTSEKNQQLETLQYIAPLFPGFLSSLFAVISIITLARFVTGYIREETEQQPEYGAIRALVSEISTLIKSFKGKD